MVKFNFDGTKVGCPDRWEEVSVEHFIRPEFLSGNSIKLLAALSGVPASKLANATQDMMPHFEKVVQFLKEDPKGWMGGELPETFTFLETECTIPRNIEMRSFGQKIMLGQALVANSFLYKSIPDAIAIYLGNQIYPDDWFERLEELKDAVLVLPINQVYPVAAFFLSHSQASRRSGKTN
jgi:hypothetical protein